MMTFKIYLRAAAILMLVHLAGHLVGHTTWRLSEDPAQQEVIRQMTEKSFPFMGSIRSFGDYYEGYGWICTISLIFIGMMQLILSYAGNENRKIVSIQLIVISVCLFAWGMMEILFFFPFAAGITLLSAIATALAAFKKI